MIQPEQLRQQLDSTFHDWVTVQLHIGSISFSPRRDSEVHSHSISSYALEKLCDWRNKCLFVNLNFRALANPSCGSLGQNTVTSLSLTHMAQVQAQLTAEWALLSGLGFGRSDLSKKLHCLHLLAQSSTWPRISHHWESRYTRFSGHISLGLQLRCIRTIHTLHQQGYC